MSSTQAWRQVQSGISAFIILFILRCIVTFHLRLRLEVLHRLFPFINLCLQFLLLNNILVHEGVRQEGQLLLLLLLGALLQVEEPGRGLAGLDASQLWPVALPVERLAQERLACSSCKVNSEI